MNAVVKYDQRMSLWICEKSFPLQLLLQSLCVFVFYNTTHTHSVIVYNRTPAHTARANNFSRLCRCFCDLPRGQSPFVFFIFRLRDKNRSSRRAHLRTNSLIEFAIFSTMPPADNERFVIQTSSSAAGEPSRDKNNFSSHSFVLLLNPRHETLLPVGAAVNLHSRRLFF